MEGKALSESEHGPCPDCGLLYARGFAPDERYHRRVHDAAVNGHRAKVLNGLHAVTHKSSIALQKLAQVSASAARWETKYDFPSFVASKKADGEYNTPAMLYVEDGRVCGLLVSRERDCSNIANLSSFRLDGVNSWRPIEFTQLQAHRR